MEVKGECSIDRRGSRKITMMVCERSGESEKKNSVKAISYSTCDDVVPASPAVGPGFRDSVTGKTEYPLIRPCTRTRNNILLLVELVNSVQSILLFFLSFLPCLHTHEFQVCPPWVRVHTRGPLDSDVITVSINQSI